MEYPIFTDWTIEEKMSKMPTGEAADFQWCIKTPFSGLLEIHWREVCRRWEVEVVAIKLSKVNWFQRQFVPWLRPLDCMTLRGGSSSVYASLEDFLCLAMSKCSIRVCITWNCWQHKVVNMEHIYTALQISAWKDMGFGIRKKHNERSKERGHGIAVTFLGNWWIAPPLKVSESS